MFNSIVQFCRILVISFVSVSSQTWKFDFIRPISSHKSGKYQIVRSYRNSQK